MTKIPGLYSSSFLQLLLLSLLLLCPAGVRATEFKGTISEYASDSVPYWPEEPSAPQGAPNVLIWLVDDLGFGQVGSFGGMIDTPNIDRLADTGLRYTNFHATALCSPSRAALLTGRNHHAVGMGSHAMVPSGFPGYYGRVPKSAGSIARILSDNGYATYMAGKWDQLPAEDTSVVGPFDQWPTGQGFQHFYGFVSGDTNQFHPGMWSNHDPVEVGGPDYHVSTDIADKAISWVTAHHSAAPNKPFFLYWSTGAVHAPHQAPQAYLDKYRGRFDMGWDKLREIVLKRQKKLGIFPDRIELTQRQAELPAWDSLTPEQKTIAARQMEAFAAQLDHADHEFGRIVDTLKRTGQMENTIIIVLSDNGASAEGGVAGTYNEKRNLLDFNATFDINGKFLDEWGGPLVDGHYSAAWALAGNTPFAFYKQSTRGGGVNVPMLLSWPKRIHGGEMRRQFHHINDIVPTLLDVIGIEPPGEIDGIKQQRLDGVSMAYSFTDANAETNHPVQYFEMLGNRGIYAHGWKAVATARPVPWNLHEGNLAPENAPWELYHVKEDINETVDLKDRYPDKLAELKALFDREARANNVYPIGPDGVVRWTELLKKQLAERNSRFDFYTPGAFRLPYPVVAPTYNMSYRLTAQLNIPKVGGDGVIAAEGSSSGGFVFFVEKGKPVFVHSYFGEELYRVASDRQLKAGPAELSVTFLKNGAGGAEVTVNLGIEQIAAGTIPRIQPGTLPLDEYFDVGQDSGSTVSREPSAHSPFNGGIDKLTIEILHDR